ARLRALAFALGAEQEVRALLPASALGTEQDVWGNAAEVDDEELLAYLLDQLPAHRRVELEGMLRGDAQAFGRLATLHSALYSKKDERDQHRLDYPGKKIPRHDAGMIEIRSAGAVLHFKNAHVQPGQTHLARGHSVPLLPLQRGFKLPPQLWDELRVAR